MCRLDRRLVAHMGCHLRAQTATCVMDTFGISINSWVKMREDQPVRRALAERLIMRLDASGLLPASIGDDGAMTDRKRDVQGQSVSVRVDLGGGRIIKKQNEK